MTSTRSIAARAGIVAALFSPQCDSAALSLESGGTRIHAQVLSLQDIRQHHLVRQGWDTSCGAAALSTLLTHYFKNPASEASIVITILHNSDPERVRARKGFSLLDLKRYAEAVGFEAKGYGSLSLQDLLDFKVPSILPVKIRNYDHFVVFRGVAADRVALGDPAFGNITLTMAQFEDIWKSRIGFVVTRPGGLPNDENLLTLETLELMVPNLNAIMRSAGRTEVVPALSHPPLPLR